MKTKTNKSSQTTPKANTKLLITLLIHTLKATSTQKHQNCQKGCKTCRNSLDCTECESSYTRLQTQNLALCAPHANFCFKIFSTKVCTSNCKEDEYEKTWFTCAKCSASKYNGSCKRCKSEKKCTECFEGYKQNKGGNFCFKECPKGEYNLGWGIDQCVSCKLNIYYGECAECEDFTGKCLVCEPGYQFDQFGRFCRKSCGIGEYWSGMEENGCQSCRELKGNQNCWSCLDLSGECSECDPGFRLNFEVGREGNFCRRNCSLGSYWTGRVEDRCEACSYIGANFGCKRCSDLEGKCQECRPGHQLLLPDGFCRPECAQGSYWPGRRENVCKACSEFKGGLNCLECRDLSGECVNCKPGFEVVSGGADSGFCRLSCEDGYFWSGVEENRCLACSSVDGRCVKCEDRTGNCQKCVKGYRLIFGVCLKDCEVKNCLRCPDDLTECSLCEDGYELDAKNEICDPKCSEGEYWKGDAGDTGNQCGACSEATEGCVRCLYTSGECSECQKGAKYYPGVRLCGLDCETHQFWNKSTNECQDCTSVDGYCSECQPVTGNCLRCQKNFELSEETKKCQKECKEGEYWSGEPQNECISCSKIHPRCLICRSPKQCLVPQEGFRIDQTTQKIYRECPPGQFWIPGVKSNCRKCSSVEGNQDCLECEYYLGKCSKCKKGFVMAPDSNFCHRKCPESHFWDGPKNNDCLPCSTNFNASEPNSGCKRCRDYSGQCSECLEGYKLDDQKFCRKACKDGFFWSRGHRGECSECPGINCELCEHFSGICSKCKPNFYLNENNNCRANCSESEYIVDNPGSSKHEDQCRPCSSVKNSGQKCLKCSNTTGECLQCQEGYHLNRHRFCQRSCDLDEYWEGLETNQCRKCGNRLNLGKGGDSGCLRCLNVTGRCLSCQEGFWLSGNKCLKECLEVGEYLDESGIRCMNCPQNCLVCANRTGSCQLCDYGFDFLGGDGGACLPVSEGYYVSLVGVYLQKYIDAVVFVFGGQVSDRKLPQNLKNIKIELVYSRREDQASRGYGRGGGAQANQDGGKTTSIGNSNLQNFDLKVKNRIFEKNYLKLIFELPQPEINNATMTITSEFFPSPQNSTEKEENQPKPKNQKKAKKPISASFRYEISSVNLYTPPSIRYYTNLGHYLSITLKIMGLASIFISLPIFASIATFHQTVSLLRLINGGYSSNYEGFLHNWGQTILTDFKAIRVFKEARNGCRMSPRFYQTGQQLSCLIFNSQSLPVLIGVSGLFFVGFGTRLMVLPIKKALNESGLSIEAIRAKKDKKTISEVLVIVLYWFRQVMGSKTLVYALIACQIDLLVGAFISLKYLNLESEGVGEAASYVLSILIVSGYTLLASYTLRNGLEESKFKKLKSNKNSLKTQIKTKRWQNRAQRAQRLTKNALQVKEKESFKKIRLQFKETIFYKKSHFFSLTATISLNFAFPFIIVFGSEYPLAQLLSLALVMISSSTWMVLISPHESLFGATQLFKSLGLIVVFLISAVSMPRISTRMAERTRYNSDGNILVLILTLISAVEILAAVYLNFVKIRCWVCQSQAKKGKSTEKIGKRKKLIFLDIDWVFTNFFCLAGRMRSNMDKYMV